MRKIAILALLFACQGEITEVERICGDLMISSNALPVQFWPVNCDTYNEKEVCGVHPSCYCAPWNCDDEIKLQIQDDPGYDYELSILQVGSENNQVLNSSFDTDLSDWTQTVTRFSWRSFPDGVAIAEVAIAPVDYSTIFYQTLPEVYPIGTTVRVNVEFLFENASFSSSSITVAVKLYNSLVAVHTVWTDTQSSSGTLFSGSVIVDETFELTGAINQIGIELSQPLSNSGNQVDIIVKSIEFFPTIDVTNTTLEFQETSSGVYNLSLVLNELDIPVCDDLTRFVIIRDSIEVAKSDCLDVQVDHPCTNLIEYSNDRDYAGLVYANQSPDQSFLIRVPSVFFHERHPEEDELIELTSTVVNTASQAKKQRRLDLDYMPYYMHYKLQLILKHKFLTIDGINWTKEEKYELEEGSKRWPKKSAKVWLTENNSITRNVL